MGLLGGIRCFEGGVSALEEIEHLYASTSTQGEIQERQTYNTHQRWESSHRWILAKMFIGVILSSKVYAILTATSKVGCFVADTIAQPLNCLYLVGSRYMPSA